MEHCLELRNVSKKYPGFQLKNINMEIEKGSIVGLIGENGAGKTTTLKLILDILRKDSGEIKIFGMDLKIREKEIKKNIGVVMDDAFFSDFLNATDIHKIMKGMYENWDEKYYFDSLKKFDIPKNKLIKNFSSGMKMKHRIITAIAHHPKLLILDEPTSGLDPIVRNEILDIFREFVENGENTILFSTHITSDLEHVADYIVFIHQGSVILKEEMPNILDDYGILRCKEEDLAKIDKSDYITYRKEKYQVSVLVNHRSNFQKKYKEFVVDGVSLEELMMNLIKGESKNETN